jgi:hypothetical protein
MSPGIFEFQSMMTSVVSGISGISHREALIEQFHCPADWKCIIA